MCHSTFLEVRGQLLEIIIFFNNVSYGFVLLLDPGFQVWLQMPLSSESSIQPPALKIFYSVYL